jgi:hypothetical protein
MRTRTVRRWDVPDEFWLLLWRSRWGRTLVMQVQGEPRRKAHNKTPAADFQRQVMDAMDRYRRYPFAGPVALDLHFRTTRRNPPSIYHAAKHALDLLGPVLPGNERPRRRSVLYRDDRQVKFLYIDLDQGWHREAEPGGSTFITARRASDVITDLCMAHRLSGEQYDEGGEEASPFWVPDLPDDAERDWLRQPGPGATALQRFLADVTRFHYVSDLQETILARSGALLASGLSMYLDSHTRTGEPAQLAAIFEQSRAESLDLLLSSPLMLPCPGCQGPLARREASPSRSAAAWRGSVPAGCYSPPCWCRSRSPSSSSRPSKARTSTTLP